MKKRCAVVVAGFVSAVLGRIPGVAEDVSGPIGGDGVQVVWTKASSPYRVVGDVQVFDLRIEPGVRVVFEGDHLFDVRGTLLAQGAADDLIVFTSADPGSVTWKGMLFDHTPPGSELLWCVVEYANSSGVRIVDSTPRVERCLIRRNTSNAGGGTFVFLQEGDLVIRDCALLENTATIGGGLDAEVSGSGTLRLERCLIARNRALPGQPAPVGGGARASGDVEFDGCLVTKNAASSTCARGGGLYVGPPPPSGGVFFLRGGGGTELGATRLVHSSVQSNTVGRTGGFCVSTSGAAVYLERGTLEVSNSILSTNEILSGGTLAGLYVETGAVAISNSTMVGSRFPAIHNASGTVTVENSILFFNNGLGPQITGEATVTYSCVQGGFPGAGNIGLNPGFLCDADLRLARGSPCVDAGNPTPALDDCSALECAGLQCPSLGNSRNDMGAYGGPGACLWEDIADCNQNCIDDQEDIAARTSHDCDGNGWPDECDIARVPDADQNGDGLLDRCTRRSARLALRATRPLPSYAVLVESDTPFHGGELCIRYDPAVLRVASLRRGPDLPAGAELHPDPASEPMAPIACEEGLEGFCIGWINPGGGSTPSDPGTYELLELDLELLRSAPGRRSSPVEFAACLEDANALTNGGGDSLPLATFGTLVVPPSFVRGDANDDSRFDISDPISILLCLFQMALCPERYCADAADADDSGRVDLNDPVYLLTWRFRSGPRPRAPYPDCHPDPTDDDLPDCSFRSCR